MATELVRGVNHFHSLLDKPIKLEISLKSSWRCSQYECKSESAKTEAYYFSLYIPLLPFSTSCIVSVHSTGIILSESHKKGVFVFVVLFCTQLTFGLILRPWGISRLGIHLYWFYYTCRNIISMDASFYPILLSDVFLH